MLSYQLLHKTWRMAIIMSETFVRPSRDLRNHYAELANIVKDHNHVIITNNGKGESVLISMDDYSQYEEFLHHRYLIKELEKAQLQAADPNVNWSEHDDVWNKVKATYGL